MKAITIGLEIAKAVFQVHGEDAQGRMVVQRRLRRCQVEAFFARQPASVVGLEACGSAHDWGRRLRALGHEARLIPPRASLATSSRSCGATRPMRAMRRLATIPGVGAIVAHAIVAPDIELPAGDGRQFRSARDVAAWAGLTPQEHSSAGKRRDKGISRRGDGRLRKLLALGASTIMRNARSRNARSRGERATPSAPPNGSAASWRAGRSRWRCWHRPPRPRASPGRCSPPVRPIRRIARAHHHGCIGRKSFRPAVPPAGGSKEQQATTATWSGPGPEHADPSSRLTARRHARRRSAQPIVASGQ